MALGDGIRRDVTSVSQEERDLLRDAIIRLHTDRRYPGAATDMPLRGGVSFWFKQDEIHDATHVHSCPPFLPWHRELINRFEDLLRLIDPRLSLHYWDWTTDPVRGPANLFTSDFMGSSNGQAGPPWEGPGLYDPNPAHPQRDVTGNPADPPGAITRQVGISAPLVTAAQDIAILSAPDYPSMRHLMEDAHNQAHTYIGGTIGNPHVSFRDPFVFFLHSNVDRLFAEWQHKSRDRLNPATVYGSESNTKGSGQVTLDFRSPWGILSPLEPWAGVDAQNDTTGIVANFPGVRPWATPDNEQLQPENRKDSKHPSVVHPRLYDTINSLRKFLQMRQIHLSPGIRSIRPPVTSLRLFMGL